MAWAFWRESASPRSTNSRSRRILSWRSFRIAEREYRQKEENESLRSGRRERETGQGCTTSVAEIGAVATHAYIHDTRQVWETLKYGQFGSSGIVVLGLGAVSEAGKIYCDDVKGRRATRSADKPWARWWAGSATERCATRCFSVIIGFERSLCHFRLILLSRQRTPLECC